MKLKYQKEIDSIDNCPAAHEAGEKTFFRCVEDPLDEKSFNPQAVIHKPKFKNMCIAWGLSVSDIFDAAATRSTFEYLYL